jgi:uncharacterized protein
MIRRVLSTALFALLAFPACAAESQGLIELGAFPQTTLEIHSGKQTHAFHVWLAETPEQQEQGLMFVRELSPDRGMLFLATEPRVFNMWMKNTYIALDMVFIAKDGRIARIAERTTPFSLAVISSDVPVTAILEIKGGEAARRALHPGDRVNWIARRM